MAAEEPSSSGCSGMSEEVGMRPSSTGETQTSPTWPTMTTPNTEEEHPSLVSVYPHRTWEQHLGCLPECETVFWAN